MISKFFCPQHLPEIVLVSVTSDIHIARYNGSSQTSLYLTCRPNSTRTTLLLGTHSSCDSQDTLFQFSDLSAHSSQTPLPAPHVPVNIGVLQGVSSRPFFTYTHSTGILTSFSAFSTYTFMTPKCICMLHLFLERPHTANCQLDLFTWMLNGHLKLKMSPSLLASSHPLNLTSSGRDGLFFQGPIPLSNP